MRRIQIALLAVIAVACLALPGATAQASTTIIPGTAYPRSAEKAANTPTQALTKCYLDKYGHRGWTWCEMEYSWSAGGEYFVVGTDYAIWHIWPGASRWYSLGGRAQAVAGNGAWHYTGGPSGGVGTIGVDGGLWCRDHPWTSGWFRCT